MTFHYHAAIRQRARIGVILDSLPLLRDIPIIKSILFSQFGRAALERKMCFTNSLEPASARDEGALCQLMNPMTAVDARAQCYGKGLTSRFGRQMDKSADDDSVASFQYHGFIVAIELTNSQHRKGEKC